MISNLKKAVFLTNKSSLYSAVTGGVQLCSQEFLEILNKVDSIELKHYYVSFTKHIIQRILIKIGFENYSMYDVEKDKKSFIEFLRVNKIEIVFINMASLVRYAKPIKEVFGNEIRIILMSHGNHSGDFLHLISKPITKVSFLKKVSNKIRLGLLISTESEFRVKYVDAVVALSETEAQIENWFGAKQTLFLPRKLHSDFLKYNPIIGRVGFVGRLDHPPNLLGMEILLNEFKINTEKSIEIRLVGAPEKMGKLLEKKYSQVTYLGELSNDNLETEVATWALLLNPVWWYSTGASTKLAKAISWGVPIVTTTAGMRGYKWHKGNLLVADTPKQMHSIINNNAFDLQNINTNTSQTQMVANSGYSIFELAEMLKKIIL